MQTSGREVVEALLTSFVFLRNFTSCPLCLANKLELTHDSTSFFVRQPIGLKKLFLFDVYIRTCIPL